MRRGVGALTAGVLLAGCGGSAGSGGATSSISRAPARIDVSSPAFANGGAIPREYTCDGRDVSPPLRWSGVPASARQLYVVMLDRGVPGGTFHHWAIRFPATVRALAAGEVPAGAVVSSNDFGSPGYGGPCPPHGASAHHYVIGLSALRGDTVVAYGTLVGTYARR
jgi:Raf kinase inhibitor-like YbhB/YbcL family protein